MQKRPPWIKFSFDDFTQDPFVQPMTDQQIGMYIRLLNYAYRADPPATIPADVGELRAILRYREGDALFDDNIGAVLKCFKGRGGPRLTQKRLWQEMRAFANDRKTRSENAKKGWQEGAHNQQDTMGSMENPDHARARASSSSSKSKDSSRERKAKRVTEKGGVGGKTGNGHITIPAALDFPAFVAPWLEWVEYRNHLKRPKDPEKMFREQLAWLEPFGPAQGAEILKQSIRNGWQGLFELKSEGRKSKTDRTTDAVNSFLSKLEKGAK